MEDESNDSRHQKLREFADRINEEFAEHRAHDSFKEISPLIDDSTPGRETLIVHLDGDNAPTLADEVEAFLIELGAQTEREVHSKTDIRILAIPS